MSVGLKSQASIARDPAHRNAALPADGLRHCSLSTKAAGTRRELIVASESIDSKGLSEMSTASLLLNNVVGEAGTESERAKTFVCAEPDPFLKERLVYIQDIPLFYGLTKAESRTLAATAHMRDVSDGQAIFREGQPVSSVTVLIAGRVKLTRLNPSGLQLLLKIVDTGQVVGALGVTPGSLHTLSAQASGTCRVLTWEARTFDSLCQHMPGLARNGLCVMAERHRLLEDRFFELLTEQARVRLARLVIRLLEQSRCPVTRPARIEGLVQLDISQMIGTTLWTANRLLREWQDLGLLEVQRGVVIVPNPKQLILFAERISAASNGDCSPTP
jgi:CRP-like cAMP-binding protein